VTEEPYTEMCIILPADLEELDPLVQGYYLRCTDAALAAMETPTEAMLDAGYSALTDNKPDPDDIFRAMIRAAGE